MLLALCFTFGRSNVQTLISQAKFALLDDPTFAVVAVNGEEGERLEDGL